MKKRIMAALLAVMMLAALLPAAAFAGGGGDLDSQNRGLVPIIKVDGTTVTIGLPDSIPTGYAENMKLRYIVKDSENHTVKDETIGELYGTGWDGNTLTLNDISVGSSVIAETIFFLPDGGQSIQYQATYNGVGLEKIDSPKKVSWDATGKATWGEVDVTNNFTSSSYSSCTLHLMKKLEGGSLCIGNADVSWSSTAGEFDFKDLIQKFGAGVYYYTIIAKKAWDDTTHGDSDTVISSDFNYTAPSEKLPTPTLSAWDKEIEGMISIESSTSVDKINGYNVQVEYKANSSDQATTANSTGAILGSVQYPFFFINDYNGQAGYYKVRVRASSGDINSFLDSDWSEWSTEFHYTPASRGDEEYIRSTQLYTKLEEMLKWNDAAPVISANGNVVSVSVTQALPKGTNIRYSVYAPDSSNPESAGLPVASGIYVAPFEVETGSRVLVALDYPFGDLNGGSPVHESFIGLSGSEITVTGKPAPGSESTPAVSIDYTSEKLTGFGAGNYTVNGVAVTATDGKVGIKDEWVGKTVEIVKKGDGEATADSAPQTLDIPARPAAPSVAASKASSTAAKDGSLSVTVKEGEKYEYRISGGAWIAVPDDGSISELASGDYEVRIKATSGSFASIAAKIKVEAATTSGGTSSSFPSRPFRPSTPATTETSAPTFADVAEGDWFASNVAAAANAGLIAGFGDGSFNPTGKLTWAQTVTFAVRVAQKNAGEDVYGPDDQTGTWYDVYVDYAKEHGLVGGLAADPNAVMTRADAAVIFAAALGNAAKVNDVPEGHFADVPASGPVHDAVYALAAAGVINGKSANADGTANFGVGDTLLRSEVATIIARMAGLTDTVKIG